MPAAAATRREARSAGSSTRSARSDGPDLSENELEVVIQSARLGEGIDDGSRCYAVFNWAIPSGDPTSARSGDCLYCDDAAMQQTKANTPIGDACLSRNAIANKTVPSLFATPISVYEVAETNPRQSHPA